MSPYETYKHALDFLKEHGYLAVDHIDELLAYIYSLDIRVVMSDIKSLSDES